MMKLTELKGIGPKTEALFFKLGVRTAEDLLHYYPVGYDAYDPPCAPGADMEGQKTAVKGVLTGYPSVRRKGNLTILTAVLSGPYGKIRLNWYNSLFLKSRLVPGREQVFRGVLRIRGNMKVIDHPEIHEPEKYAALSGTLVPVYGLTAGLSGKTVAKAVREAFAALLPEGGDYLPVPVKERFCLTDAETAIRGIHFPQTAEMMLNARKRLVFDEFFLFILALRSLKEAGLEEENHFPMQPVRETEDLIAGLPFRLTEAQLRVWHEVEADLSGRNLMSRMIQGDVGSGKTIVAFLAMLQCVRCGWQSAMMAPTEVLARQHFEKFTKLKETYGLSCIRPVLLCGSMKASEKKEADRQIADGSANIIIGTHALFQDHVGYDRLALVITDEQHRFGVRQRRALLGKGFLPHTLVMSATPIPRTLAVAFYGDMAVSVIDEMPAGRTPVKNAVVDESARKSTLAFIGRQLAEGRQVYVVCPMIEPAEELVLANVKEEAAFLKKVFPDYKIGKLHGRMKTDEKNAVMEAFADGSVQLLVSTTVIEVGVDVPNATVMVVENAERFGLAQLHQLRGRVGRGKHQSYCVFMAGQKSEAVMARLGILKQSSDGFVIAEKDLALRGPGDLLGIRQSGDPVFTLADISRDGSILQQASETADAVLAEDPWLNLEKNAPLKAKLQTYLQANERNITL